MIKCYCSHCGRNDHRWKSNALCPHSLNSLNDASKVYSNHGGDMLMINEDQLVDMMVLGNIQEIVICASSACCRHGFARRPCKLGQSNGGK